MEFYFFRARTQAAILFSLVFPCFFVLPEVHAQPALWNIAKLQQPPVFRWLNSPADSVRELLYTGLAYHNLPSTSVFAYYASPGTVSHRPDADKDIPAMVLIHGGGGTAFKEWVTLWAKRGYAAIAIDLGGMDAYGKRLPDGGPGQDSHLKFISIDSPLHSQWIYHSVANIVLAHSLLGSLPGIDKNRIGVTGISWGGFLACIVAGLDHRFKLAIPVYGCGYIYENDGYFYQAEFRGMTPAQKEKWINQYDPSRYLPNAHIPFLWVTGARDTYYQPSIFAKSYALVRQQSNFRILPRMTHGHLDGWLPQEIGVFADQYLLHGRPLPKITHIQLKANKITARVQTGIPLLMAGLSYTLQDSMPFEKRIWMTDTLPVTGTIIKAPAPPAGSTIWLLSVKDVAGNLVSGPYQFSNRLKK